MSPHEMTSAHIEQIIANYRQRLDSGMAESGQPLDPWTVQVWTSKVENLEKVLKDRANDGTYQTAGM